MIAPAIPENETDRIAALYELRILDTPPEDRFDRITQLASKLFNVPIAYLALVDSDRQWLKSRCGINLEETARELLALLRQRQVTEGDQIRWVPPEDNAASVPAFSIRGFDGIAGSPGDSMITVNAGLPDA